jgi:hypothetical protein
MRAQLRRIAQRTHPPRRGHTEPPAPEPAPVDPEALVREAGGPEDTETHACECGYVFEAAVSTSVACPHCGAAQAW